MHFQDSEIKRYAKLGALLECLEIFPELDEVLAEGVDDPARVDTDTYWIVTTARMIGRKE